MDVWQLFVAVGVFLFGLIFIANISRAFKIGQFYAIALYLWHSIYCVIYWQYSLGQPADAIGYYDASLGGGSDFSLGTSAVENFVRLFSYYLNFSYFGIFLVFNIIGAIGLLAFDASLSQLTKEKSKIIRMFSAVLVLLPSISFWSAAIGKDAIAFMAMGLALWAAMDFDRRIRLMVIAILAMLIVRPHIAGIMVIAVAGSVVIRGKMGLLKKTAVLSISVAALAVVVPFALKYAGLDDLSNFDAMDEYVSRRQSYNQDGGGGIDLSAMSPPMQLFAYLFRPLPFEAHSLMSLAASFDNVILLLIFVLGLKGFIFNRKNGVSDKRVNWSFLWLYSGMTWIVLSVTTANLGISVRQKWMFLPMMLVLMVSMMPRKKAMQAAWSDRGSVAYRGSLK